MERWVTVAVFMLPTEMAVARGLLESEEIPCRTLDEFTVQVHNLYSQAIGGVKLQVQEADADRARSLLLEGGFIHEEKPVDDRLARSIEAWTERIPLLGRLQPPIARVMVLVALLMAVVLIPIALASRPSMADRLANGRWCVERVIHDGVDIEPNSTGLQLIYGCPETILFRRDGTVYLPGFDTPNLSGIWFYLDKRLRFVGIDDDPVYEGSFAVAVNDHHLTLRSHRTTVYCSREPYGLLY